MELRSLAFSVRGAAVKVAHMILLIAVLKSQYVL